MDRVLNPAQIEALAARSIPRLIVPPADLFERRAMRLESLAAGHAIEGYLRLVATIARLQQRALDRLAPTAPTEAEITRSIAHAMPPLPGRGMARDPQWRAVLREMVATLADDQGQPPPVTATCHGLLAATDAEIEALAERMLAASGQDPQPAAALFVSAALQVLWTGLARRFTPTSLSVPGEPGPCPVCGSTPVASTVRSHAPYEGYRYLCCGLCAAQWHRVRVECTQCGGTKRVAYQSIEGGSSAIRAETCDDCGTYRKIFYQEHEPAIEPLADDLASLALDLLLTEAGFSRAGANPLYWQLGS